jgi:hypothetical protein
MKTRRNIQKIMVVHAITSLMLVLFFYNNDVFARRGYDAETEQVDYSFINGSKYPGKLNELFWLELIYGDHKIDVLESKFLVNAAFRTQSKTDANGIAQKIQPIAVLMTVFLTEANAIEACISAIQSQTNYSNEQSKKLLEEEIGKNRSLVDSVKPLCQEIIAKDGNVTMNKEGASNWFFYQLLKTSGITPSIFSKFITNNQLDICYALESLHCMRDKDDYYFAIADYIVKKSARIREKSKLTNWFAGGFINEQMTLAKSSVYMSMTGGNKLIDILLNTIPHSVTRDGEISYRTSIETPDWTFYLILNTARRRIQFCNSYWNADNKDKLLAFFAAETQKNDSVNIDKSWLLYRYHPELIQPLEEIYSKSNIPANYDKAEIKAVLSGVVEYGEILKEYAP